MEECRECPVCQGTGCIPITGGIICKLCDGTGCVLEDFPRYRDEMTEEQEMLYVSALYDLYESHGFSKPFWSCGGDFAEYIDKPFKVVERVQKGEGDLENLPMWNIEFDDGNRFNAHPDEIILKIMIEHGYKKSDWSPSGACVGIRELSS